MLIDSPRLTGADRAAWARMERYDHALGRDQRLARKANEARQVIDGFTAGNRGYVGVSWGKDSVVAAHLAVGCGWPLVWLRAGRWDNPDCEPVRDAFLAVHDVEYHEVWMDEDRISLRHRGDQAHLSTAWRDAVGEVASRFGDQRITGVRAEESSARQMSASVHGVSTERSCRPILRWTGVEVFAYLAVHDLPVHPSYAMTGGGVWDRIRLRVGSLGGEAGAGAGRVTWEETYYRDRL